MIWWLLDQNRARAEKAAFSALQEEHDWLTSVRTRHLVNLQLCIDIEITHRGEEFQLSVIYPVTFPDTPPIVMPHGERRLSQHQYGPGGELCLQWRPDNWDPAVTGAMMAESAYGLISGERPSDGQAASVSSDHRSTLGGELRFETWRLMVPNGAWQSLDRQMPEAVLEISLTMTARRSQRVAHLRSIGAAGNEIWKSRAPAPTAARCRVGFLLRTGQDMRLLALHGGGQFKDLAKRVPELASLLEGADLPFIVVIEKSGRHTAFDIVRGNQGHPILVPYRIVEENELARRSASDRDAVSNKRVAIIGCGSIGSKIAASLARAGVSKFLLIDEDILLTGNLVRNELDAWAIGWHKVDALADRIGQLASDTYIDTHRVALGSQTSGLAMESALESIGECDLIVDATANSTAFNLCAGAARRHMKPMIWAEVFGGGVGGLIARARPDTDPHPLAARRQIMTWCDDQNTPWEWNIGSNYEVAQEDGQSFTADDADVSVVSAHAARFALDILQGAETNFPSSAYLIGLKKAWLFAAPFDTWPIDLKLTEPWQAVNAVSGSEEVSNFLSDFIDENVQ
jgi:ubiquitin-protein ligase